MQVQQLLEEYFQLDHEDQVGGVKTRFKYRTVPPINDGLHPAEILALQDKDLNAIIGLRKLATYHEDTQRIRPNYKALTEARTKLQEAGLYVDKRAKKPQRRAQPRGADIGAGGVERARTADVSKSLRAKCSAGQVTRGSRGGGSVRAELERGQKKKRPGPALRRALKASADTSTEALAAPSVEKDLASVTTEKAEGRGKVRMWKDLDAAPISDEQHKRRRMESYGKLTLPGGGGAKAASAGDGRQHKLERPSNGGKRRICGTERGAVREPEEASGLSKANKKNKQRARKRQERRQLAAST
jgi:hypothetical protein